MIVVTFFAVLWAIVQTLVIVGGITLLLSVVALTGLAINYYSDQDRPN